MDAQPTVLRSRREFAGKVFDVRVDDLRFSDGGEARLDVVEHAASVAIVATPSPGELVLVRQYRHPTAGELWEIPAGMADPNETPLQTAARELREETGYRAARLRLLGSVWTTPGFCSELMHFVHADELTPGETDFDDDERIEIGTFTTGAAWRLVARGTADAKTLLALYWLQGERGEIGTQAGR